MTQTQAAPGPFSTYLAITSFGIGTLLLLIHLSFQDDIDIMIMGFFYILIAILLNSITLIHLLYNFIINRLEREIIAIRMLILLANIPIALLYLNIVLHTTN
ncbi:hypothetical protein [Flavobacterium sangjuense]|uniref:Uncharacterized protein n=1 Tax=Flavobacterium sangjuense TaxID=2518177 RepID=A0A4V1CCC1_9FLAO|nr:hypothetical protein [Flavobacterium sangjuense]QBZ98964.1 hypothetical protein GS03_02476 [Flavobacterium sangjuense]